MDAHRGSLKTIQHVAKFGWAVLLHPLYSPDLAPYGFHLFKIMKDGIRGHFPDDTNIADMRKWVTTAGADFYKCSIQVLVHCWQKRISSGGQYVEQQHSAAENLFYPMEL
jgi:transposase